MSGRDILQRFSRFCLIYFLRRATRIGRPGWIGGQESRIQIYIQFQFDWYFVVGRKYKKTRKTCVQSTNYHGTVLLASSVVGGWVMWWIEGYTRGVKGSGIENANRPAANFNREMTCKTGNTNQIKHIIRESNFVTLQPMTIIRTYKSPQKKNCCNRGGITLCPWSMD